MSEPAKGIRCREHCWDVPGVWGEPGGAGRSRCRPQPRCLPAQPAADGTSGVPQALELTVTRPITGQLKSLFFGPRAIPPATPAVCPLLRRSHRDTSLCQRSPFPATLRAAGRSLGFWGRLSPWGTGAGWTLHQTQPAPAREGCPRRAIGGSWCPQRGASAGRRGEQPLRRI